MLKSSVEVAFERPSASIRRVEIRDDLLLWTYIDGCQKLDVWNWKEKRLLLVSRAWITLMARLTPR